MVLHTGLIDTPPEHGMTFFTVASILATMKIRVTISAGTPDFLKFQIGMAPPAIHVCMHAAERTPRFRVLEIREGSDWFKAC
jgi:hypothetical protein